MVNKLTEKCTEKVEGVKLAKTSSTLYVAIFLIIFLIKIGISGYFLCFSWFLKKMLFMLNLVLLVGRVMIHLLLARV